MDHLWYLCLVFVMLSRLIMLPCGHCWERWLLFVMFNCVCYFPIGILGQVWYLIVSIPYLCTLTYFDVSDFLNQLFLVLSRRKPQSAKFRSRAGLTFCHYVGFDLGLSFLKC